MSANPHAPLLSTSPDSSTISASSPPLAGLRSPTFASLPLRDSPSNCLSTPFVPDLTLSAAASKAATPSLIGPNSGLLLYTQDSISGQSVLFSPSLPTTEGSASSSTPTPTASLSSVSAVQPLPSAAIVPLATSVREVFGLTRPPRPSGPSDQFHLRQARSVHVQFNQPHPSVQARDSRSASSRFFSSLIGSASSVASAEDHNRGCEDRHERQTQNNIRDKQGKQEDQLAKTNLDGDVAHHLAAHEQGRSTPLEHVSVAVHPLLHEHVRPSAVEICSIGPSSQRTYSTTSMDPSATSKVAFSGNLSGRSSDFRSGSIYQSGRRDPDSRVVFINNPEKTNERYEYAGNKVRTSKYTLLSFLPKNLFEQFHRVAYLYFLVILCLNQIPQLAVFGRTASLLPLLFVLVVTAIKDGYEDFRRHRSDIKENYREALVYQDGEFKPKAWKHVLVGEMVKVLEDETIPCDLVLLRTSDPSGVLYVQTINLDGESNLKTRYALLETAARLEAAENNPDSHPLSGRIVCEKPNRNIYGFTAYAELEGKKYALGPTNIILRGCELKNTAWVVGVVVYAGQETKAMLNSAGAQSKRSRLEQNMNRETLWLSFFLFVLCFTGGLGTGLWLERHATELDKMPFYGGTHYQYYGTVQESIFAFLSCLISFQIIIPISLYISMELVRLGQAYFMIRDGEMFHSESNTRFQCRALNINEDLGQIKYVFSDKTGTLTQNKMQFCCASIYGVNYKPGEGDGEELLVSEVSGSAAQIHETGVKLNPLLCQMLRSPAKSTEAKAMQDFMLTLAACNTVVPMKQKRAHSGKSETVAAVKGEVTSNIDYQGESPDEQALVRAASAYGYTLVERTTNYIVLCVFGELQRYEVLGLHEFDSVRKCMSVVLRCPDESIKVLVKGADSAMFQKLEIDPSLGQEDQSRIIFETKKHIDLYSREGLRTLAIAARDLSATEIKQWQQMYATANTSLTDRMEQLQSASQLVESKLSLLGATGIEDKLQIGVPEAIATLREAGIKVWVLTGDKQETAISIGFSCALLTQDMQQIIINESEKASCHQALKGARSLYVLGTEKGPKALSLKYQSSEQHKATLLELMEADAVADAAPSHSLALIIDGNSLVHALDDDLKQEFFNLATVCKVVICCRVAPLQKAGIVSLVKQRSQDMTLAIGDGANDVSMIQMADVGVGISGQEGRQAVLASDFAMGQFMFLKHLLLVHGHLNYWRLGYMVLYNFYRNAVFAMLLFWYILYTAFSVSPAINDWSLVFYSLIYTSVPTIAVAILDRDLSHTTLLKYPCLYRNGQRSKSYNKCLFWLTMLDTLWQSLILFFVPYTTFYNSTVDIWSMGSVWTISVVVLVTVHLAMDIGQFTWVLHVTMWGSVAATYLCIIALDVFKEDTLLPHYGVMFHVAATPCYWLNILLIVCLALLPRFICKVAKQHFWPSDIQIARESEILNHQVKRLG